MPPMVGVARLNLAVPLVGLIASGRFPCLPLGDLAALFAFCLHLADPFQWPEVFIGDLPQQSRRQTIVIMPQHVPDAGDFPPRDFRVAVLDVIGEMATGFGDDLEGALDDEPDTPIVLKRFEFVFRYDRAYVVEGLDHVVQARKVRFLSHQNTRTASFSA